MLALALCCLWAAAEPLPIRGIAYVEFRVSDLDRARAFYTGVLGYEEAFRAGGAVYFKVNDDQFLVLRPDLKEGEDVRLGRIAFEVSDLSKLSPLPFPIAAAEQFADGNRGFTVVDGEGQRLVFLQSAAGSLQQKARGRFLPARRISKHLLHTGVTVQNLEAATNLYIKKLGFTEFWRGGPSDSEVRWINLRMPGDRGDYVELMLHQGKPTRAQLGSMHHICLEVPDIQVAYKELLARGVPAGERHSPRIGRNRRWLLNLFDADGSRTELMEPKTVDSGAKR
ncbi:MAG: VOC family protein [Acidobacteria bacterium]|nr:VOC family protein [Acidobacteriota bacterium]